MKNKVSLIGIAAILLSLTAVTIPVAAQESPGWHWKFWAPEETFTHEWTGRPQDTRRGLQYWVVELGGMMPSAPDTRVTMTIIWNPVAQKGWIKKFDHDGVYLHFSGWKGTIERDGGSSISSSDGVYHFEVSGLGIGSYGPDSTKRNLFIFGSFKGVFYSDGDANPGPFERGYSEATERALLIYCVPNEGT